MQLESSASLSPEAAVRLRADPYKISQVIRNLVSNALKFTSPSGSVRLSLSVEIGDGCNEDVGGDADIETGRPASIATYFTRRLRHSRLRYSKTFAEGTYLVIRVQDSGVGISAVGVPLPVHLILSNLTRFPMRFDVLAGEPGQALQGGGAVPARAAPEGTGHGAGPLQYAPFPFNA